MMRRLISVLIVLILAACGGSDDSPGQSVDQDQNQGQDNQVVSVSSDDLPAYGLEVGAYTLNISGAVEGGTGYTGTRTKVVTYSSYGTATNYEGNTVVMLYWDGVYNGTTYDVGIQLILRDGITPGTYEIGNHIFGGDDVDGKLNFDDFDVQDFGENVSGTLTLDSANRQYANGTFEFTAENDTGEQVTVSGSFHAIPFERDPESSVVFGGVLGDDAPNLAGIGWDLQPEEGLYDIHIDFVATRLTFLIPLDATVGTYTIGEEATATWDYNFPATGTLELTEAGAYYSGSFDLSVTTDAGDSTITGSFDAIPVGDE